MQKALQPNHNELVIEFAQRKRDVHIAKSKANQIKKFGCVPSSKLYKDVRDPLKQPLEHRKAR